MQIRGNAMDYFAIDNYCCSYQINVNIERVKTNLG